MAAPVYQVWSGATSALTGPLGTVATSATAGTVKTILQILATRKARVVEWGYGFDAAPANPVRVELVTTGTVAATVTAHSAASITKLNDVGATDAALTLSTSGTGFDATAEGTITATRLLDYEYENGLFFKKQYPLGREPEVAANDVLRLRATPTSAAAVQIFGYIAFEQ